MYGMFLSFMKNYVLLSLVMLVAGSEGRRDGHGLKELRALVNRLHAKYDKPMDQIEEPLISDEAYRRKKHKEDLIKEYLIE